jgi:hypothetical protein
LGLVAVLRVELAAPVTELWTEATELVREPRAEVMESRSEPVAVTSCEEKDERRLAASLLTDSSWEVAAEVMEETTELEWVDSELSLEDSELATEVAAAPLSVLVRVIAVWAEAYEARATRKAVQRMVTG